MELEIESEKSDASEAGEAGEASGVQYCCQVCGDLATCYRLYGAKSVCYSCRIFFRRAVKAGQTLPCKRGSLQPCTFDKFTRNHCKKCRYERCLAVGMKAYLVDSCRRQDSAAKPSRANPVAKLPLTISTTTEETPLLRFTFTKEVAIRKFENICVDLFFNSPQHYSLIEIDKQCIQQIRDARFLISTPSDAVSRTFEFSQCAVKEFLSVFLPELSGATVDLIAGNVSLTVFGISCCAFRSFTSRTLLEQYQNGSIIALDSIWNHYKQVFPDIENLKPVPIESYDICSSPYAQRFEVEQFIDAISEKFSKLLKGDLELGKIIYLLALVSPVGLDLASEEVALLKEFQQKISIMLYNHLMSKEELDNILVLQTMYQFVSLLENLNRCGAIFHHGLINHGDQHGELIENINVDTL